MEQLTRDGSLLMHRFDDYDPVLDLGIHPPIRLEGRPQLPPYAERSFDHAIDGHMSEGGFILLEGDSASGKTRSAYEAATRWFRQHPDWMFIRPRDGKSLRQAAEAGISFSRTLIWLDDLENYLSVGGLDASLLRAIMPPSRRDIIVLATIRTQAKNAFNPGSSYDKIPSFAPDTRRVFGQSRSVSVLREFTPAEIRNALTIVDDDRITDALKNDDGIGLAEYLSAGPAIYQRWLDGKQGVKPWGSALVSAAIDFRRAGYLAPIPTLWLKKAAASYINKREARRGNAFKLKEAFEWATETVHGASACLEEADEGYYVAFDYLVDFVQNKAIEEKELREDGRIVGPLITSVPDDVWHILIDEIKPDDQQFLNCVSVSTMSPHPGLSLIFKSGIESGAIDIKQFNTGAHLFGLAQLCLKTGICVVCQIIILDLDLALLVEVLIGKVEELFDHPLDFVSIEQNDALSILSSFAGDKHLINRKTPIFQAVAKIPHARVVAVGHLLEHYKDKKNAKEWLRAARMIETSNPLAE